MLRRSYCTVATMGDGVKGKRNKAMFSVRQCADWGFRKLHSLLRVVDFEKQIKLFEAPVNVLYQVSVLLNHFRK